VSQRNSGYIRKEGDQYETPSWVTEALLGFISTRPGSILEPAAGSGQMVQVLKDQFRVLASDIAEGVNFFELDRLPDASVRGGIAILLRCDFDHAKRRGLAQHQRPHLPARRQAHGPRKHGSTVPC